MDLSYTPSENQPPYETDPAGLPALLRQLVADLANPAVTYLLGAHYYDRTNYPRYRHFPAVFALRQGEVSEVEIGADFLAFNTTFIRYPDRGEPGYPGPNSDHFRATVPLSQLYQLCRKMLGPTEQGADAIEYGPETVVYYNAAVHSNHPTPADINQAYAATPPSGEHPLVAVLTAVQAGLADPANHYLINTTSFASPAGPVLMGMLHLNAHTVWDLHIENEAFTCAVLLNSHERQPAAVRVPFAHVWQVVVSDSPQVDLEEVEAAGGLLYEAPEVLRNYARQGRLA
jgi:hypothetical protein